MADKPIMVAPQALNRYRVVSAVEALVATGQSLGAAVRLVASVDMLDDGGHPRRISTRTVYRWHKAYQEHGLAGLTPAAREPGPSVVLSSELVDFVRQQRELDRDASLPELIRRAREQGIVRPAEHVNRVTLWRTCQRLGIETRQRKRPADHDRRRFRHLVRMQQVLADFTRFRAGPTRARRLALYFLDNATRMGLAVAVCTSENTEIFLSTLRALLVRFGIMDTIYLDRGTGFRSDDTTAVLAQLGIPHILGAAGDPEAHGAVERFNRTAKARLLRSLDRAVDIDPDCGALTLRLRHDLFSVYNHLPHEALGLRTPQECWTASERPLRPPPNEQWLSERFTVSCQRRVSGDNVIKHGGAIYDAPRGHAGELITVYRRVLEDNHLYVSDNDSLVRLQPVDLALNAISPRAGGGRDDEQVCRPTAPATTASTMAYQRTYGCVLDQDGGYHTTLNNDEE